MTTPTTAYVTLADTLWTPVDTSARAIRAILLVTAGALFLTISAKLQVPFWPVPMTMQTFAVAVIGMAYGWRLALATVLFYLLQGAMGLPVFAGTPERGLGLAYMAGPTGGYLVGFALCATLLGWLAERGWDRDWLRLSAAMTLGHLVIIFVGASWLAALIGLDQAIAVGVTPFWTSTVLKVGLGVAVMPVAWKLIGSRRT